jgi:hypothetical protein
MVRLKMNSFREKGDDINRRAIVEPSLKGLAHSFLQIRHLRLKRGMEVGEMITNRQSLNYRSVPTN